MNSRLSSLHLSEDDLDEILMGIASPDASAHLVECEPCGERFAAFQSQLDAFNHATMAWSEARANTISRDLSAHKPTPRLTLTTIWTSAATAVLALAFAISAGHHGSAPIESAKAPAATATSPVDQVASDNAMLAAIDSEIVTPQPDRFGLYEAAKDSAPPTPSVPEQARD